MDLDALVDVLDLRVAWKRVKVDLVHRVFIRYPHEVAVIESDLNGWLDGISTAIRSGTYRPDPLSVTDVPKGGGLTRPGCQISMIDMVVYTACVGACLPYIHPALNWAQGSVDFGYQLNADHEHAHWLVRRYQGWTDFRERSLERLEAPETSHVVFADISAFYENIDLGTLMSDLRTYSCPDIVLRQLATCLNRWAMSGRGIPQGISASDVLAKLYLNSVDLRLKSEDFEHLRYVDDIRIFCSSVVQAKRATARLITLLRQRGLHVQSAKTHILTAEEGVEDIKRVVRAVEDVSEELIARFREAFDLHNPYIGVWEIDALTTENPEDAPAEVAEEAYERFFKDPHTREFDSTFFHFLLARLGKLKSFVPYALNVTAFWRTHPEETQTVLKYLTEAEMTERGEDDAIDFLHSEHAIYPFQVYQFLQWLAELPALKVATVSLVRKLAFDPSWPLFVRAAARTIVCRHGNPADLERLETHYAEAATPLERAELICCLRRMEVGRRNTFLGRVIGDGPMERRAVEWVRNQPGPRLARTRASKKR